MVLSLFKKPTDSTAVYDVYAALVAQSRQLETYRASGSETRRVALGRVIVPFDSADASRQSSAAHAINAAL